MHQVALPPPDSLTRDFLPSRSTFVWNRVPCQTPSRHAASIGSVDGWHSEWRSRFDRLMGQGLEATIRVHCSKWTAEEEGLWVIAIEPVASQALWAPRFGVGGAPGPGDYHISLCEESAMDADALARLKERYDGKRTTIRFGGGPTSGGTLLVAGDLSEDQDVRAAHARGWYADRPLHVSF